MDFAVKGLAIGGFGWNGKYTNESYKGDGTDLPCVDRKRWGVGFKYDDVWSARGEYIASKGQIATDIHSAGRSDAWYLQLGAPIFKDFKLFGRWDCYRDDKHWSSLKVFMPSPPITISANILFSKPTTRSPMTVVLRSGATITHSTYRWPPVSEAARTPILYR